MADPRFFKRAGPFSLAELASRIEGELAEGETGELKVADVAPLDRAGTGEISFLDNPKYLPAFKETTAAACIIHPRFKEQAPDGVTLVLSHQPYRSYALAAQAFYPESVRAEDTYGDAGQVAAGAHVHPTARLGENVTVEPGAVVSAGVEIGSGCVIASNAVIARNVTVGRNCYIRVIIQDDVEIGANYTIDRGAGPDTIIGAGTKIDNLVQIGHNVTMGQGCIIVAQCGLSGSSSLGDYVAFGARAGLAGHIKIGDGVQVAARSSIIHDIPAGERWGGTPAKPVREWQRELAAIKRLGKAGFKKTSTE